MIRKLKSEDIQHWRELETFLSHCPFHLVNEMEILHFQTEGSFFLPQDKTHPYVYIILEGEFEIFVEESDHRKVILDLYDKLGTLIGEQEAILNLPYSSSVCNLTPCTLLRLTCTHFLEWIQQDKDFSQKLLHNQCEQVYHLAKQAAYYTLHSAKEQVALCLYNLHEKGGVITKVAVQRSVATSVRHTNRILSELASQQIIQLKQSTILVLQPEKLLFYGGN